MCGQVGREGGRLDVRREGDVLHVALAGPVDMVVRERHSPALWRALDEAGVRTVEVDAGAVTFLDSSGLSVLVRLARDTAERGLSFLMVAVSTRAAELLEHTGVGEWMTAIAHDAGPEARAVTDRGAPQVRSGPAQ